jgi:DNA-binding transcriptional regulator LsrR (DeoR family)
MAREAVRELPPSAKLVYKTLEYEGGLTQSQLATETMLPPRTVRDALSRLEDADIVEERIFIPDARKSTYALAEALPASTA